ncbi:MAG: GNAT family N-acetyltransferase [Alphaproteobacteria bacterium]
MIVSLAAHPDPRGLWSGIEEIFFLSSSRQVFTGEAERQDFLRRWTGYYRDRTPDLIFVALAREQRLAGYLMGCRDSRAARRLYDDIDSYRLFDDLFGTYPAHFHVNCHPDFRRRGIGTALVRAFVATLVRDRVAGVHVVTAAGSDNVAFYRKCGLRDAVGRPWGGRELVFLGKRLRTGGVEDGMAPPRR